MDGWSYAICEDEKLSQYGHYEVGWNFKYTSISVHEWVRVSHMDEC